MLRNNVFIVFLVLSIDAVTYGAPQFNQPINTPTYSPYVAHNSIDTNTTPIPIVSQAVVNSPDGSFNYSYETGNGIKQQSSGFHKTVFVPRLRSDGTATGEQDAADILVQTGSYSYTAPDGSIISLTYISDENGFQPIGDHLPTPPPIPEQILRSLQQQSQQNPQFDQRTLSQAPQQLQQPQQSQQPQNSFGF